MGRAHSGGGDKKAHRFDSFGGPIRGGGHHDRVHHHPYSRPIQSSLQALAGGSSGYSGHGSEQTSRGSYSRPSDRGGYSGSSMTVQQPMARGACFECGETGHYARECPRSRQGSRVQTSRPPALPARGGGYSGRGGSQSGRGGHQPSRGGHQSGRGGAQSVRGGSQAVRSGCGGTQSEGGRAHFYAF
ncbi:cold shock protein 2-like [Lycium barbarum]|uniref:cold shock protein 2-like n=1 Tax=Lycium barbarum TaxID=112863 RepID=UPI00293EAC5F|nr:cold shock protein 2-like [Lycium barbarum]